MADYRGFRISEIHVICGVGPDDEEGIPAIMTEYGPVPLVASDKVRLEQITIMAQTISDRTGQTFKVVRFTHREDVGELTKRPPLEKGKHYLVTISVDGGIKREEIEGSPPIEQLNEIVGGPIELVPLFNTYERLPCVAFCNEEGKLPPTVLEDNITAHLLWEQAVGRKIVEDRLVGPIAIIVGPPSFLSTL